MRPSQGYKIVGALLITPSILAVLPGLIFRASCAQRTRSAAIVEHNRHTADHSLSVRSEPAALRARRHRTTSASSVAARIAAYPRRAGPVFARDPAFHRTHAATATSTASTATIRRAARSAKTRTVNTRVVGMIAINTRACVVSTGLKIRLRECCLPRSRAAPRPKPSARAPRANLPSPSAADRLPNDCTADQTRCAAKKGYASR